MDYKEVLLYISIFLLLLGIIVISYFLYLKRRERWLCASGTCKLDQEGDHSTKSDCEKSCSQSFVRRKRSRKSYNMNAGI